MPYGRLGRLRNILPTSSCYRRTPANKVLPFWGDMRGLEKISTLGSQLLEPSSLPLPTAPADQLDGLDQPAGHARYQVSAWGGGLPGVLIAVRCTEAASPHLE